MVEGGKKQIYFLTADADASASSVGITYVQDVGISEDELMDWTKPANTKAKKRILILNACSTVLFCHKTGISIVMSYDYMPRQRY